MDDATAERLTANEHRFREVNERLQGDLQAVVEPGERVAFVCECSLVSCRETVPLTLDEYGRLRAYENRFALVDRHERLEIERVVEREARYIVVEKRSS